MTASKTDGFKRVSPISVAAYYLRNAAPEQFDKLLEEVGKHVTSLTNDFVFAPTEDILRGQGRVQQARFFHDLLSDYEAAKRSTP
jgi:hypothetical protein